MDSGHLRRMDAHVAARMLSALFITHGNWFHQRTHFASIANIPGDQLFEQIRDFFLHAMRPDVPVASSHA